MDCLVSPQPHWLGRAAFCKRIRHNPGLARVPLEASPVQSLTSLWRLVRPMRGRISSQSPARAAPAYRQVARTPLVRPCSLQRLPATWRESQVADLERSRFMLGVLRRCILRSFAFALAATPSLSGRIHPRDSRGRGTLAPAESFIAACKVRAVYQIRYRLRSLAGRWSFSRQRSWDFWLFAALLSPDGWLAFPRPQPTCRSSKDRAAVLGSGSRRKSYQKEGRFDQGSFAAASRFSAWQAVPGLDLASRCCHELCALPGIRTHRCAPAGSRHLGRPPARGVLLPVPDARELGQRSRATCSSAYQTG